MLYLEDYLELIEHLPLELRDRFTDIRERDLQVHNSTEQLREKAGLFFADAKKLKPDQRQCEYEKLINEYQETIKYADDKVRIANQMHEIMIKLGQRLDIELEKFKLELEADHAGITEELEKRSLELDAETRLDDIINNNLNNSSSTVATTSKTPSGIKDRRRSEHKHRHHPYQNNLDNGYQGRAKLSHEHRNTLKNPLHHNNSNHHLHHNNNNPHHQRQGSKSIQNGAGSCRQQATPSPNQLNSSSYLNSHSGPPSVSLDLNGAETQTSGHYESNLSTIGPGFKDSLNKNKLQNVASNLPFSQQHSALSAALSSTTPQLNSVSALSMMNADSVHNKISNHLKGNDSIDPNSPLGPIMSLPFRWASLVYHKDETKYCICRQISYGEMVACDNDECEIEWFHYECVGITQSPKGKWFCPDCTRKMNGLQQNHASQPQQHKKRGRKEKSLFNMVNNSIETARPRDRGSDQSKSMV